MRRIDGVSRGKAGHRELEREDDPRERFLGADGYAQRGATQSPNLEPVETS